MPRKTPVEPGERARASTAETQVRPEERHRSAPSLLVSCASGAWAVPLAMGRSYVLGRTPECDVVLDDPSVSRRHALLTVSGRHHRRGSREAPTARRSRAASSRRASAGVLALGTVFEVGSATLVLQRTTALGGRAHRTPTDMPGTVVRDPAMKRLYEMLDVVAPTGLSVLILGETGVGKEVFAEALHRRSSRVGAPFLKLNCAALPESHPRGRAVRLREGRLHRRDPDQGRALRGGRRRHALPGRGGRDGARARRPRCCARSRAAR